MVSASARVARSATKSPDDSSVATNARDGSVPSSSTTTTRSARVVPWPEKTKPKSTATTIGQTNVKNIPDLTRNSTRRSLRASARMLRTFATLVSQAPTGEMQEHLLERRALQVERMDRAGRRKAIELGEGIGGLDPDLAAIGLCNERRAAAVRHQQLRHGSESEQAALVDD